MTIEECGEDIVEEGVDDVSALQLEEDIDTYSNAQGQSTLAHYATFNHLSTLKMGGCVQNAHKKMGVKTLRMNIHQVLPPLPLHHH